MKIIKLLITVAFTASLMFSSSIFASGDSVECKECKGKIDNMIVRYDGSSTAYVVVTSHKGAIIFSDYVSPGQQIALSGALNYTDKKNTLGPRTNFSVDGIDIGMIHTSCSVEIGPGTILGDFVVLSATSRINGMACPVAEIPEPPCTERCG